MIRSHKDEKNGRNWISNHCMTIRVLTHQNSLISKESYRKVFDRSEANFHMGTSMGSMHEVIFFLPKVIWEHHSSQLFLHKKKNRYGFGHIWQYKLKIASVRSKTFLYDSLETREFLWVKNLVAIQRFEVHFRASF